MGLARFIIKISRVERTLKPCSRENAFLSFLSFALLVAGIIRYAPTLNNILEIAMKKVRLIPMKIDRIAPINPRTDKTMKNFGKRLLKTGPACFSLSDLKTDGATTNVCNKIMPHITPLIRKIMPSIKIETPSVLIVIFYKHVWESLISHIK